MTTGCIGEYEDRELTTGPDVEERPFFGGSGDVYFVREESADERFLYRMKPDGSARQKLSDAITFLVSLSPDEQWAVVWSVGDTRWVAVADRRSLVFDRYAFTRQAEQSNLYRVPP